jgi:AraC-like DNA-binding protein
MNTENDIIKKVKLSSSVYFKSDFSAPWGINIPKGSVAQFHIVTRGQCVIKIEDKELQLFAGDIIVLPLGTSHWIADSKLSARKDKQEVIESLTDNKPLFEGDNISTTLLCGHFEFDRSFDHPLIKELPEIIHISDMERKEFHWLESIVNLVIQETGSEDFGSYTIADKLGEVLFIHILRAYILRTKSKKGFIAAISDSRINKALNAIHNQNEKNWKLPSLAQKAGMSRTSFSNLFKKLLGETPSSYITNWRMIQAKELLKESTISIGEISDRVGYQSVPAFNHVFKKRIGQTPLRYRQSLIN